MSLFGKLDAASINTNPYWVEKGEYSAEVTKAEFKQNRDGDRQLSIVYTITDEDSQFNGSKVNQFYTLPSEDMTEEDMTRLPAEDQRKLRLTFASMKRTLCGSDNNSSQRGLGVPVEDLNDPGWNPSVLVGTKVDLSVRNYGANNEGVSVNWVNLSVNFSE